MKRIVMCLAGLALCAWFAPRVEACDGCGCSAKKTVATCCKLAAGKKEACGVRATAKAAAQKDAPACCKAAAALKSACGVCGTKAAAAKKDAPECCVKAAAKGVACTRCFPPPKCKACGEAKGTEACATACAAK